LNRVRLAVLLAAAAAAGAVVVSVVHPAGSHASGHPRLVSAALQALQTPAPGEFPAPATAVSYLVAQVRAQNLDAATRVMPLAYYQQRATFLWQVNQLQSLALYTGFFPKQPFSKFALAVNMLQHNYTWFAITLLDPQLASKQVQIVRTSQQARQLQAQLDPAQLDHLSLLSYQRSLRSSRTNSWSALGATRYEEGVATIGGLGTPRRFTVDFLRFGTNWLVSSVDPKN
jgi:hypothetical protein